MRGMLELNMREVCHTGGERGLAILLSVVRERASFCHCRFTFPSRTRGYGF
jgi:hypothetical protein